MCRTCIQESLEPVRKPDDDRILDYPHANCKLGPEVTHFKEKRFALHKGNKPRRDGLKDLGRCAHNQVDILHLQSRPYGTERKADKGNHAPEIAAVQRLGTVGTQDAYTFDSLLDDYPFLLDRTQTGLIIRIASDNDHVMPGVA